MRASFPPAPNPPRPPLRRGDSTPASQNRASGVPPSRQPSERDCHNSVTTTATGFVLRSRRLNVSSFRHASSRQRRHLPLPLSLRATGTPSAHSPHANVRQQLHARRTAPDKARASSCRSFRAVPEQPKQISDGVLRCGAPAPKVRAATRSTRGRGMSEPKRLPTLAEARKRGLGVHQARTYDLQVMSLMLVVS